MSIGRLGELSLYNSITRSMGGKNGTQHQNYDYCGDFQKCFHKRLLFILSVSLCNCNIICFL